MSISDWKGEKIYTANTGSQGPDDSHADRYARMRAISEKKMSEVNPLCKDCRYLRIRMNFYGNDIMVFCERSGNVNAEGTECYYHTSEIARCETCALAECLGTMLGGRKVLRCPLGTRACVGKICRLYRRKEE